MFRNCAMLAQRTVASRAASVAYLMASSGAAAKELLMDGQAQRVRSAPGGTGHSASEVRTRFVSLSEFQ
jgi:hypothetical protein